MRCIARHARGRVGGRRAVALAGALALAASLLAGCGGPGGPSGSTPRVVTSFYPLQYVARRIAGDHAHVSDLTQPGREPHDLELSIRQTGAVEDADLVVYERGFQAAVDDAVDQTHPHRVLGDDPHFWLDPTRLSAVAVAVERRLAEADPAHRRVFAKHLAGLRHDLAALDASFTRGLASCRITTIVVSHDAFGYLGRRYGLKVVGINGLSPDAEPSASHIQQLQNLIRSDGITTVFSEQLASRRFADSLAGDLHIKTAVLDPIEGLSDTTADQSYLSLMRRNLVTLRKADRCS